MASHDTTATSHDTTVTSHDTTAIAHDTTVASHDTTVILHDTTAAVARDSVLEVTTTSPLAFYPVPRKRSTVRGSIGSMAACKLTLFMTSFLSSRVQGVAYARRTGRLFQSHPSDPYTSVPVQRERDSGGGLLRCFSSPQAFFQREMLRGDGGDDRVSLRELLESKLTGSIIDAFYEVYNTLGFGFLEHVYKAALQRELLARGHLVAREMSVVVRYKGEPLVSQRLDMVVDDKVVIELKSTATLPAGAKRQLHNYLRATKSRGRVPAALRTRTQVLSCRRLAR